MKHPSPKSTSPTQMSSSSSSSSTPPQHKQNGRASKNSNFQQYVLLIICMTAAFTWSIAAVVMQMQNFATACGGVPKKRQLLREDWTASIATSPSNVRFSSKEAESKQTAMTTAYNGLSRVWEKSKNGFPCYQGNNENGLMLTTPPAKEGMFFQRPTKVGSTTMVGIILRLVHNRSPWMKENIKCSHRSIHGTATSMGYINRDHSKSFLFGLVREPTKRAISQFFHFNVAVGQAVPTDENLIRFLNSPNAQNVYVEAMSLKNFTSSYRPDINHTQIVQDIINGYDFIAVTERMDESLVVMQMLLNLTTKEILYTKARSSGTFSNGFVDRPCIYITPSFTSPGVKKYLESDTWQVASQADSLLHQAASASLDRTIAALGKDEFDRNMHALKQGLALVEEQCQGKVITLCTEGGVPVNPKNTPCYIWSEGCDHDCIDSIAEL